MVSQHHLHTTGIITQCWPEPDQPGSDTNLGEFIYRDQKDLTLLLKLYHGRLMTTNER